MSNNVGKCIGDAKLAEAVIKDYAHDLDGLTSQDLYKHKYDILESNQPWVLYLSLRRYWEDGDIIDGGTITDNERLQLSDSGFCKDFIDTLAGQYGNRALLERVKWLGDHAVAKRWRLDYSSSERRDMIAQLGNIGPDAKAAIDSLIRVAQTDEDVDMRLAAIRALGEIGGEKATYALVGIAQTDEDSFMRTEAIYALSRTYSEKSLRVFIGIEQTDEDSSVRNTASRAVELFGRIGGQKAIDTLVGIARTNEDTKTHDVVVSALTIIARDFPFGGPLLVDYRDLVTCEAAVCALGEMGEMGEMNEENTVRDVELCCAGS